ncbi:ATP-dependent metalloprotease [Saprolegnia diclina VS20]|uniref:ATP-dependent metalloprotease n=1 Tax=Saprolegnia diclina (strain VS20) TaxID=1156394 RepID=T0QVA8_SAPDV|nr:ATP-dependent metalloprotease [Saprolegnia diclina VS20]EQC38601.1 ATP-dependent metalloprotease [Saprolegnia diclina VS20]|eukprot:XP_008608193.1 ATP-dependent metalloprotease [Saprolegnia diclina VS20]
MAARSLLRMSLWQQSLNRLPHASQNTLMTSEHHLGASLRSGGLLGPRRNFFSFSRSGNNKKLLKRMEQDANAYPEDAQRQLKFLQALNKDYPSLVIRRVEEGRFVLSQEAYREYIKALVATNRIDSMDTNMLFSRMQAAAPLNPLAAPSSFASLGAVSMASDMAASSAVGSTGLSPIKPMYVSMVDGGFKKNMWRTARVIALGFMAISAMTALIEEKGLGGVGVKSKVTAAIGSDKKFSDVKGVDEAKEELEEIVQYLKDPDKFTRLGGNLPKGVLLMGPPGTGKTLLARAIAGEAGVPFFYSSGAEFEEMYVGVGARRVRDLFDAAKKKGPCIVFIDEIDAIGGTRHLKEQSALKMTLNQLLVEMDGFDQNKGIIVIGATNFPESLDSALTRPGRFDRHVTVPLPDIAGRRDILELYTKKIPLGNDVDLNILARATPGMSGAELSNLVNEATLRSSFLNKTVVDMAAFEFAKDKILMGAERKSALISPESARLTAYHEGGHALVAIKTPGAHPVYKATIMPRGNALGMVSQLPEDDQTSITRKQLLARLDVCMGGRVAEEMVFGKDEITGGASSDIQQATRLAHLMVTKYGMSDEVGVVFHDLKDSDTSPATRTLIDQEVRKLCDASYKRATTILQRHRTDLETIAKALLEYETLSGPEIKQLLQGEKLARATPPTSRVQKAP